MSTPVLFFVATLLLVCYRSFSLPILFVCLSVGVFCATCRVRSAISSSSLQPEEDGSSWSCDCATRLVRTVVVVLWFQVLFLVYCVCSSAIHLSLLSALQTNTARCCRVLSFCGRSSAGGGDPQGGLLSLSGTADGAASVCRSRRRSSFFKLFTCCLSFLVFVSAGCLLLTPSRTARRMEQLLLLWLQPATSRGRHAAMSQYTISVPFVRIWSVCPHVACRCVWPCPRAPLSSLCQRRSM